MGLLMYNHSRWISDVIDVLSRGDAVFGLEMDTYSLEKGRPVKKVTEGGYE